MTAREDGARTRPGGARPRGAGKRARAAAEADAGATARSGALNLTGAAVSALAGLLLTLAVTRLAAPATAGVFFVAMTVFLVAESLAGWGAGTGTVYLLPRRRTQGQVATLRAVMLVAAGPTVAASLVVAAAVAVAAPWLAERAAPEAAGAATTALRVVAVFLPAAVLLHLGVSAARGLGRTRPFVVLDRIARPGLQVVAVTAVGLAGIAAAGTAAAGAAGAGAVAAAWAVPYVALAALAVGWTVRMRRRLERDAGVRPLPPARADWREFWRFAAPRGGTGLAQVGLQRFDVLLVGALLGAVEVALYVAASRFLVVGQLVNQGVGSAVAHRFAALAAAGSWEGVRGLYRTTTGWLVLASWPLLLLCIVYAGEVLALFGDGYPRAATAMQVLCGAMLLGTGCGLVSTVLEMTGRSLAVLRQTLAALMVNVGLNLLLLPLLGLPGAAVAWAGAIAVNNLLPLWLLYRSHRLHPFGGPVATAMAAAVGCFGVLPGAVVLAAGVPASVPAAVAGAAVYAVVLWRGRQRFGLTAFRAVLRRRRAGRARRT